MLLHVFEYDHRTIKIQRSFDTESSLCDDLSLGKRAQAVLLETCDHTRFLPILTPFHRRLVLYQVKGKGQDAVETAEQRLR